MGRVLFALTLMVAGIIQASLSPSLQLLEVMPDFALVFLLIWSASYGVDEGLIWAFGLGLWLDFLTLTPLGSHAIPMLVVALVGGAVRGRFLRSGAILPIVAVVVATIGFDLV
ncbi:MAG: rod shape-determining protein MreD, partial [Chloroflexota bacterium]